MIYFHLIFIFFQFENFYRLFVCAFLYVDMAIFCQCSFLESIVYTMTITTSACSSFLYCSVSYSRRRYGEYCLMWSPGIEFSIFFFILASCTSKYSCKLKNSEVVVYFTLVLIHLHQKV